jgi:hypothetical protein
VLLRTILTHLLINLNNVKLCILLNALTSYSCWNPFRMTRISFVGQVLDKDVADTSLRCWNWKYDACKGSFLLLSNMKEKKKRVFQCV